MNSPSSLFKILMHPTRLSILEILRDGEQCVCHLEAVLGQRQAYISQHLMVLRDAKLVEDRREGSRMFYRVVRPEIYNLVDQARAISGAKPELPPTQPVVACPCPKCNSAKVELVDSAEFSTQVDLL